MEITNLHTEKQSILVVDDQPNNIKIISSVLSELYNLYIANSGEKALSILEKVKPDLILLDVMMPAMSGFEVCERIKNNPNLQSIPIIFLTAKVETDDIVKGFELGAVDYITKPFNTNEIKVRIRNHITLSSALKTIKEQNEALTIYQKNLLKLNEELIASKDAIEQNAFQVNLLNSKLIESEEELLKANESLEKANQEKDKFFSIIAHDLRSPFSGFLGLTEILVDNEADLTEEEKKDFIINMKASAEKLFKLLENLLEWARLQRGTMTVEAENTPLNYVVKSNFEIINAKSNLKNIQTKTNVPDDLMVYADYSMLNGILRNLLSNAVKFTPAGGEVVVDAKRKDEHIVVSVKDSGIGIPNVIIDKLFTLGEKTARAGTDGEASTGLGLLLCKDYLEKMGCKIWVESEEQKGSTFYFTLPKAK